MSEVRTRFAPSPTGEFHIGSARTALFNWLYARSQGGKFILRLEDTDAERNTSEARSAIFESMSWLGLDWDEGPGLEIEDGGSEIEEGEYGPYSQSQRGDIYQGHIEKLLSQGKAYEDDGAVRFRMPDEPIRVVDEIVGEREFDLREQADVVIRRSNGAPVFHLVNVVDDLEMKISHVIRGEDHLSNTPKHVALYRGLGAEPPQFAHIPLILNPSGSKMSKRDQGATIAEYRKRGFLSAAVVNYLCLLGWTPEDEEVLGIEQVIKQFQLSAIHRSNARFDHEKLKWMNGEYLHRLSPERFCEFATPLLEQEGFQRDEKLSSILPLVQEKVKGVEEIPEMIGYFFSEDYPVADKAAKKLNDPAAQENIQSLHEALNQLESFHAAEIEECFKQLSETTGNKIGAFMAPCRAAVTGQMGGPSLYHTLEILGKETCLDRLSRVFTK